MKKKEVKFELLPGALYKQTKNPPFFKYALSKNSKKKKIVFITCATYVRVDATMGASLESWTLDAAQSHTHTHRHVRELNSRGPFRRSTDSFNFHLIKWHSCARLFYICMSPSSFNLPLVTSHTPKFTLPDGGGWLK